MENKHIEPNLLRRLAENERSNLRELEECRTEFPNMNHATIFHLKYHTSLNRQRILKDVDSAMQDLCQKAKRKAVIILSVLCALWVLLAAAVVTLAFIGAR